MTQAEKLEALIRKAIDGEWLAQSHPTLISIEETFVVIKTWKGHKDNDRNDAWNFYELLFNHDFARALFGEAHIEYEYRYNGTDGNTYPEYLFSRDGETPYEVPAFEYHLQQAVMSPDPIDYMYKAVFDGK